MAAEVAPPYRLDTPSYAKLRILCEAQNWRCAYCGIVCDGPRNAHNAPTRDHVVPKCKTFGFEGMAWENEIMACRLCNNSRGAMWARQYFQMVQWKGREKAARWADRRRRARRFAKVNQAA